MALELRQSLKLSQQLVMTPQLQQAIKLLQLSRIELLETVQQELLENPFLEESAQEATPEQACQDAAPVGQERDAVTERDMLKSADWEDYIGDFASTTRQMNPRETEIPEDGLSFEARLTSSHSLEGHLEWQLRLSCATPRELEIGDAIIGNLGSSGYLQATAEELAAMTSATVDEVEAVLYKVQRLDPVGVAARTPQECLLLQLELYKMDTDPILVGLVREHLEDLEKKRYKPLARKFKISLEELREYLEVIQGLDPMPGASFGSGEPSYVSPDVFVYKLGDEWVVLLNEEGLPRLELSTAYGELPSRSEKERDYLQEKMRSAQWLMKSLYQRQRTLFKVAESVVKYQREFFEHGVTQLKPLILKDIAEDIGMHESTVSRITTSKYMATPHGTFELKFFFNSALELDDGTQVGSESVKALIKRHISAEDVKAPLSDERIAEILKETLHVNIARRTVAKYRMALDIPSSSKRREMF
ncbi:RNA polymerase factor sigma-54 [Megalodesulfovibrio gigas]|uniref:Putative RNA polymerase, sigma 54 subunit, RpoN n=1 Tax=Megalodesulfovibrio gigas (strain ATCC 19364 / DSM 1382 / NCIMB 9332 / VKM B-1759) TaxID=1121448 RepID=T2GDH6_MEGG1|nr:RNA polymerase factor sigma-54 [Megalodesulfovibrio gigas]AGW14166.1 putative RNA polymerase, sigma 54 subunit, RpoN [Megalodesulfovibrio gigas DSM 1382 = ATCC 19364]